MSSLNVVIFISFKCPEQVCFVLIQHSRGSLRQPEDSFTSLLLVVAVVPVAGVGAAPVWLAQDLHLALKVDAEVG